MLTYEEQLDRDMARALLEGSMYFEERSAVHTTLRNIAKELIALGLPGEGKPGPIAFPVPRNASKEVGGIRFIELVPLIELKLAS